MMKFKLLGIGLVLALAPVSFGAGPCQMEAQAQTCLGDQCPASEHNSLSNCYDGCDWALAGELVFCQVATRDVLTRTVCQTVAHNVWGNCYRACRG